MSNKLDSVRRSLFKEFDEDDLLKKFSNDPQKVTRTSIKISNRFIVAVVILMMAIAVLSNKVVQSLVKEMYAEAVNNVNTKLDFTHIDYNHLIQSIIYALVISGFTMIIIYFDSDIPGVSPPTPFSPRKANLIHYSTHKEKTNHMGFLVAIFSGVVTFFMLYL